MKEKKEELEDMVITIGLMQWSSRNQNLKPNCGQRLPLQVNSKDPNMNILEKAKSKWTKYYSDTYIYIEDKE